MGGVIGAGIAAVGADGIQWGWKGVSQGMLSAYIERAGLTLTLTVFAAWAIAPGISGCFGAILFLITKYGVMRR
jgi:PiT family inorganic phosphate transporter/sodium-dependent phosphate transporter